MINIANSSKDKRSPDFEDFINPAIDVANDTSIRDPSPGTLAFWRIAGSSSPGASFKEARYYLGQRFLLHSKGVSATA